MIFFFIILAVVAVFVLLLRKKGQPDNLRNESCKNPGDTCPTDCFCNERTLQRAVKTDIEYFDDEELDIYAGKGANDYSNKDVARFNEVLTTLRPEETGDWLRSLELRNITLPEELKDIALILMEEEK